MENLQIQEFRDDPHVRNAGLVATRIADGGQVLFLRLIGPRSRRCEFPGRVPSALAVYENRPSTANYYNKGSSKKRQDFAIVFIQQPFPQTVQCVHHELGPGTNRGYPAQRGVSNAKRKRCASGSVAFEQITRGEPNRNVW